MYQIRKNVFETNSSSTHSIAIGTVDEYDSWKEGELLLNEGYRSSSESEYKNKKFVTREEARDIIAKTEYFTGIVENIDDEYLADWEFYTLEKYTELNSCLEWYEEKFETPGGESIVAFGYYGRD